VSVFQKIGRETGLDLPVLQRISVKSFQVQAAQAKDCAIRTAVS
jgi:hypothetical protein